MKALIAERRETNKTNAKTLGTALWIRRHTCNWSAYDDDLDTTIRLMIASGKRISEKYRDIVAHGDPYTKEAWLYLDRFEDQLNGYDQYSRQRGQLQC
jgi:hypothetical protein